MYTFLSFRTNAVNDVELGNYNDGHIYANERRFRLRSKSSVSCQSYRKLSFKMMFLVPQNGYFDSVDLIDECMR